MPDQMKAIRKVSPGRGAALEVVDVPTPGYGEVLVQVEAAAICGTDLQVYQWNDWAEKANLSLPLIMGHEFTGRIVAVGPDVSSDRVGETVSGETHIPCGQCYQCRVGQPHICQQLRIFGVHTNGCFAEYTVIPAELACRVDPRIDAPIRAVLEPLGTACRAVFESPCSGAEVAVVGCGPIGLFAVAIAKAVGAKCVVAIDKASHRLALAESLGCSLAISPEREGEIQALIQGMSKKGFDVVIEASGNPHGVQQAYRLLRKGGTLVHVGLPSGLVPVDISQWIVFREATVKGLHGRRIYDSWLKVADMIQGGLLNVQAAITHTVTFDDYMKAFQMAEEGTGGKVILVPR